MNQVKVSVIVPVYNAEKTLSACLGNLVHQTLSDMEIILVNDASTDRSLSILLDCERSFSDKIILVNLERNTGPGGARNAGLAYASGEYIGFVDSDDIPDTHMYEKLYQLAVSGNYDMVDGAYYDEEQDILILQTGDECCGSLNDEKRAQLIAGGGYLWSRIFHRELFENLTFRENVILEDMETLMLLFMRTDRLGTTREPVYKHSASPTSASNLSEPATYHQAVVNAMKAVAQTLQPFINYTSIQDAVEYSILHLYLCGITNAIHPDQCLDPMIQKIYLNELKTIRSQFVHLPYHTNKFVKQKIIKKDLELMKQVDALET